MLKLKQVQKERGKNKMENSMVSQEGNYETDEVDDRHEVVCQLAMEAYQSIRIQQSLKKKKKTVRQTSDLK